MKDEAALLGDFDDGNRDANIDVAVRVLLGAHDWSGFAHISDSRRCCCFADLGRAQWQKRLEIVSRFCMGITLI